MAPTRQSDFETELTNTVATEHTDAKDLTLLLQSPITNRELQNAADIEYDPTQS